MKIVLLKDSGQSRTWRLSGWQLAGSGVGLIAAAVLASFLAMTAVLPDSHDEQLVAEWQQRLSDQRAELASLREQAQAQSQAVGRRLADMQARLLRMEALGSRVTEVADLDEGEFSFSDPAPMGGPLAAQEPLAWTDLQSSLDELSANLKARETELEVLDSLLRDREYRQATVVSGRPVTWGWMSSAYGKRVDPFSGQQAWHSGVDFAGRAGSDVVAVASGVVTFAGKRYGYGLMVEINHGDGYVTRYGHHAALKVATGDIVKKGQAIGTMGSSGRSTGPHVHFEVLKNGRHVDPSRYVARRS
ncbi:MAG: peptidoglycan DD-metalloendopeptidase family protein [Pseudomonadales bacterium]